MRTKVDLNTISDGRVYDINDMVKADAGGCEGCSDCCHGVGDLVVLTPFDINEITRSLNTDLDDLMGNKIVIKTENKIGLPHLMMLGENQGCAFLNDGGRCSIHLHRPNICRLFPLGRFYEDDDFKYFLQEGACSKPKLGKIKVKKWIGIDNYKENKKFILKWYKFLKALSFRVKFIRDEDELESVNKCILDNLYRISLGEGQDFYSVFYDRLRKVKEELCVL